MFTCLTCLKNEEKREILFMAEEFDNKCYSCIFAEGARGEWTSYAY